MAGGESIFFGSINGNQANGWVVTPDGRMDVMRSGPFGKGYIPEGQYEMWQPEPTNETTMRNAGAKKPTYKIRLATKGEKQKLPWDGKRPKPIYDPRFPEGRTDMLLHCDGPSKDKKNPSYVGKDGDGSEGCGAFDNCDTTMQSLTNAYNNGDRTFTVKYFEDMEKARKAAEEYQKKMQQQRDQGPSKNKKGAAVLDGEGSIVLGTEMRIAAHRGSKLDNGALITQHSPSIYLGRNKLPMSGVDDATSDSSQVATGVDSIYMV